MNTNHNHFFLKITRKEQHFTTKHRDPGSAGRAEASEVERQHVGLLLHYRMELVFYPDTSLEGAHTLMEPPSSTIANRVSSVEKNIQLIVIHVNMLFHVTALAGSS